MRNFAPTNFFGSDFEFLNFAIFARKPKPDFQKIPGHRFWFWNFAKKKSAPGIFQNRVFEFLKIAAVFQKPESLQSLWGFWLGSWAENFAKQKA